MLLFAVQIAFYGLFIAVISAIVHKQIRLVNIGRPKQAPTTAAPAP
jgi:hypothetical protein